MPTKTKSSIREIPLNDDFIKFVDHLPPTKDGRLLPPYGSIISVVGKTTVEIIELFECRQKVP